MLDWDDFKDLDDTTTISASLNEQYVQLLLTALDLLDRETWKNDDKDTRDAIIAEVYNALTG